MITDALPSLNKSETKVAQVILSDPDAATQSSIATLAKKAQVSEPSVNRFCKRFNAAGFPDFKLKLAKSLASGIRFVNRNVDPDDDVTSYTPKIIDSTINTLAMVRDKISHARVNQVVDKLIQAKRIYFFGLGASGSVARDAENKFFRFNLPVSSHDDVLMQRMLASTGGTGDVFFVILGFVISDLLNKLKLNSTYEYFLIFYVRRIRRLFPALFVFVVVTASFSKLIIDGFGSAIIKTGASALVGGGNLSQIRIGNDYFGLASKFNIFTHTWSLGVEEQFYLIFPYLFNLFFCI
ncbi:MAG: acyltransferase family protein [Porticoccaceae bacterium]|nr:acyltransferase family protein [Porticoccaceae bacterium]